MTNKQIQNKLGYKTKYRKAYLNIIKNAVLSNRKKLKKCDKKYEYYENHHILPKSIFKEYSNSLWNLVLLTPKEHYICHALLWKHYKQSESVNNYLKMSKAFNAMNMKNESTHKRYDSKLYEHCKINLKHSEYTKIKMRKSFSNKRREAIIKSNKTRLYSEVTRNKISRSSKGRTHSIDSRINMSLQRKGKKIHTKESKEKMSKSKQGVNHPKSLSYAIYNNHNKIIYKFIGGLSRFCKENNLPAGALKLSLSNNSKIDYHSKSSTIIKSN